MDRLVKNAETRIVPTLAYLAGGGKVFRTLAGGSFHGTGKHLIERFAAADLSVAGRTRARLSSGRANRNWRAPSTTIG